MIRRVMGSSVKLCFFLNYTLCLALVVGQLTPLEVESSNLSGDGTIHDDEMHDHSDHHHDKQIHDDGHKSVSGLGWHKVCALVVLVTVAVAGILVAYFVAGSQRFAKLTHLLECLSAGMFLGLAFFHLLPEAVSSLDRRVGFTVNESYFNAAYLLGMLGFVLIFFVENVMWLPALGKESAIVFTHNHDSNAADTATPSNRAEDGGAATSSLSFSSVVLLLSLSVHALFEGGIVGIGQSVPMVWIATGSIAGHKWAEGFALSCNFIQHNVSLKWSVPLLTFFVISTPIGVAIGWPLAKLGDGAVGICSALALGTLLHVGMSMLYGIFSVRDMPLQRHIDFFCVLSGLALLLGLSIVHLSAHVD